MKGNFSLNHLYVIENLLWGSGFLGSLSIIFWMNRELAG